MKLTGCKDDLTIIGFMSYCLRHQISLPLTVAILDCIKKKSGTTGSDIAHFLLSFMIALHFQILKHGTIPKCCVMRQD